MADDDSAEKSHEATPKKLEDARKKGEFPKSNDLNAAASYLGLIVAILIAGPFAVDRLGSFSTYMLASADRLTENEFASAGMPFFTTVMEQLTISLAGLFGVPALAVLGSLTAQRAWVFAPQKIAPKLSRISPMTGVKNKLGPNGLFEFAKSAFKLCVVSGLLWWFAARHLDTMIAAVSQTPGQISVLMGDLIVQFLLLVFAMTLVVGGADYLWQVASHLRKNRMSRKELEDETKSAEGDPHHKQTRRQRGYEIAMNQMLADVPKADVILVNPTHYAVALKWDRTSVGAPECLAKGVDEIAARIREIAGEADIPIHSDPPTTRAIHATVDVGEQIRPEHYRAVAVAIRFAEAMRKKAGKT
jgi:flagellar biosynthetic protein FlhB